LSIRDRDLLAHVFPRVIDNAKMLRNFVQIMNWIGVIESVAL
jgi:hypothetical protein